MEEGERVELSRDISAPSTGSNRISAPHTTFQMWCGALESNQLACASGLQPDFRPHGEPHVVWYLRWESNPQTTVSKTVRYANSRTEAKIKLGRRITLYLQQRPTVRNRTIILRCVILFGFEEALRVPPQGRSLAVALGPVTRQDAP